MSMSRLITQMTFLEQDHLNETMGTHILEDGAQVDVALVAGSWNGEIASVSFDGEPADILRVMIKEWQDEDLALTSFAEAIIQGGMELL
jgi:hypothetical protein